MRRIIIWLGVLFVVVVPFGISAMDDLEKAYKEQLEYYNKEIKLAHELAMIKLEGSNKVLSLAVEAMRLGGVSTSRKAQMQSEQYQREYEELSDKRDSFKAKRKELKIKVLEKYGKLPEWWEEPDLEKKAN